MKYFFVLIAGFLMIPPAVCQSPYELKPAKEILLSGGSLGVSFPGYFLSQTKRKISTDEIKELQREKICGFNRPATNHFSTSAGKTSDLLLWISAASPLVLLSDSKIRDQSGEAGLIYLESILFASVGINLSKGLVRRPRPYVYNPAVPESVKLKNDATNSFFSGHTAMSAASAFFTAKVFSDYHPDSPWQPLVWAGAAALPLATGYNRIRAGQHFLTDVIAGYCWGLISGFVIPELHKMK